MQNEKEILSNITSLGQEITRVNDVDLLLEKILTKAKDFCNADAGSIYIKNENRLFFTYAQNNTLQKMMPEGKKLIYETFSIPVNDQSIAGYVAQTGETVNISDVYKLDKSVSFSFDKKYDKLSQYRTQSILAFPLKTPQDEILGVLQLINALNRDARVIDFSKDDEPFIMHFANSAAIALERAQMTRAIILRMLRMAEMRDPKETGPHVNRVGAFSAEIYEPWALRKGLSRDEIDNSKDVLRMAAMLHDVGKVAISDMILKKPAKLNVDEFEIMKQHTYLGAKLFADSRSDFDKAAFHIALEHHERWDGNGYPGLVQFEMDAVAHDYKLVVKKHPIKKGNDIHLFGRIVAVADVYDALSCRRCYKEPWAEAKVFATIKEESGKQFDSEIVDAFFDVIDVIRKIKEQYPDIQEQ